MWFYFLLQSVHNIKYWFFMVSMWHRVVYQWLLKNCAAFLLIPTENLFLRKRQWPLAMILVEPDMLHKNAEHRTFIDEYISTIFRSNFLTLPQCEIKNSAMKVHICMFRYANKKKQIPKKWGYTYFWHNFINYTIIS